MNSRRLVFFPLLLSCFNILGQSAWFPIPTPRGFLKESFLGDMKFPFDRHESPSTRPLLLLQNVAFIDTNRLPISVFETKPGRQIRNIQSNPVFASRIVFENDLKFQYACLQSTYRSNGDNYQRDEHNQQTRVDGKFFAQPWANENNRTRGPFQGPSGYPSNSRTPRVFRPSFQTDHLHHPSGLATRDSPS
jgi:hypothetical protein